MPASPDFLKSLEGSKTAAARWKKAKTERPSEGGGKPDLPSGQYYVRIAIICDKTKGTKDSPSQPRVRIRQTIVAGEYVGNGWYNDFYLGKGKKAEDEERNWNGLSRAVQILAEVDETEFNKWDLKRLAKELIKIDEAAPFCRIGVVNAPDKQDDQKFYLNVYYNELIHDTSEIPDFEDVASGGEEGDEEMSWSEMGAAVDNEDEGYEDCQSQLETAAEELGVDPNDYTTWEELGEYIAENQEEEEEGEEEESEEGEEESEEEEEGEDLAALGEEADGGDDDAIDCLTELAEEAGLDPDDYGDWASLAEALGEDGEEEEEEEAEEPSNDTYEKGEYVWYKPKDRKKAVECKIATVSVRNKTADLTEHEGKGKWPKVKWSELKPVTTEE